MQKKLQNAAWVLIVLLGLYILYRGLIIAKESGVLQKIPGIAGIERALESMALKTHMPGFAFAWQGDEYPDSWMDMVLQEIFPLYSYAEEAAKELPDIESRLEYDLMMELEGKTEEWAFQAEESADKAQGQAKSGAQPDVQTETAGENRAEAQSGKQPGVQGNSQTEIQDGSQSGAQGSNQPGAQGNSQSETREGSQPGTQDGNGAQSGGQPGAQDGSEVENGGQPETQGSSGQPQILPKDPAREPAVVLDEASLRDYNYLLNNFFAVDPSTTPLESQINYDSLMSRNLSLTTDNSKPQILIYHTHSQEAFIDSVEGDVNDTIVGVGNRLTEILTDTYGYNVIHHTQVYDMIDGELDRNRAYTLAAPDIQQILDENPSIEVVIDLHRDGVDGHKFVKEIDGKPTAQIMFFNGLSRTARNGEIDYLPNPYIEDNLAFSFQLQLKAAQYYPGWTRNIYLQSLRYNLHMRPKSLLIESGTQLNTVEEELNAMEVLADILNQVLRGG
ncbi:stage II sporulation protein P [Lachnospiraceae bacterium 46-15]